jgi:hypothetical protein
MCWKSELYVTLGTARHCEKIVRRVVIVYLYTVVIAVDLQVPVLH